MRNRAVVDRIVSRDDAIVASCIVLTAALAWLYLVSFANHMSSPAEASASMAAMIMDTSRAWGPSELLITFTMWLVMMIGMMSGSAAPVLLLFARMKRGSGGSDANAAVLLFALGYIAVWAAFSASAALGQWGLHRAALLSPDVATTSARFAGAILLGAGAYQLTPVKAACLRQCQSPLGFLMSNWGDGLRGSLLMGLKHGKYCLGCCWALMCVLFAVGVMNLAWVAALTAFILLEKFGRGGRYVARAGGILMLASGVFLIVGQ